jgi:hypothetical protein
MASSNWALARLEPPNQLRVRPWANSASTSRGCTTPRTRTRSSTAVAWIARLMADLVFDERSEGPNGFLAPATQPARRHTA